MGHGPCSACQIRRTSMRERTNPEGGDSGGASGGRARAAASAGGDSESVATDIAPLGDATVTTAQGVAMGAEATQRGGHGTGVDGFCPGAQGIVQPGRQQQALTSTAERRARACDGIARRPTATWTTRIASAGSPRRRHGRRETGWGGRRLTVRSIGRTGAERQSEGTVPKRGSSRGGLSPSGSLSSYCAFGSPLAG